MPALQVRDLPEEMYVDLKACAARNHRSIAQQTIAFIEDGLERDREGASSSPELHDALLYDKVREAMDNARPIRPFSWLSAVESEPDDVVKARQAKRDKLVERIRSFPPPRMSATCEGIAKMIREERDVRADSVAGAVDRGLGAGRVVPS